MTCQSNLSATMWADMRLKSQQINCVSLMLYTRSNSSVRKLKPFKASPKQSDVEIFLEKRDTFGICARRAVDMWKLYIASKLVAMSDWWTNCCFESDLYNESIEPTHKHCLNDSLAIRSQRFAKYLPDSLNREPMSELIVRLFMKCNK